MSDNNRPVPRKQSEIVDPNSLLGQAFRDLTPEQQSEMRLKVMETKLGLEENAAQAFQRFQNTRVDIDNAMAFIERQEVHAPRTGYDVKVESESASGKTTIHVKKSSVAAGCGGMVIFFLIPSFSLGWILISALM